jgi:hypothetical protein
VLSRRLRKIQRAFRLCTGTSVAFARVVFPIQCSSVSRRRGLSFLRSFTHEGTHSRGRAAHNKQLQRTVIPNHWRDASASFHYALAPRWTRNHAAAQLRR